MSSKAKLVAFKDRWMIPIAIAVVSGIVSQILLWRLGVPTPIQVAYACGYLFILVAGSRTFGFVFIYRVMIPLLFGIAMVYLYREAYLNQTASNFLTASRANFVYLQLLFDILATLYAICTAFLLWKGLTDHDNLRKLLSNEANNIERLLGYLHYFDMDDPENRRIATIIRQQFKDYIHNVVAGSQIRVSRDNAKILRECSRQVSQIKPEDANDRVALAETMKALSDLTSARSQRISQMEIGMSPYILMALGIMSCAVIFPFFTEPPSTDYIREVCIFILSSILTFLLVTLLDISRPFNGFWKIKTDAFDTINKLINDEILEAAELRRRQIDANSSSRRAVQGDINESVRPLDADLDH